MTTARIISVDGLNARSLGAYGNTWVQTPFLDQLASRSIAAENFIADSFDKSVLMQRLANHPTPLKTSESAIVGTLFGYQKTTLITDDHAFATTFGNLFQSVEWVQIDDLSSEEAQAETHFDRLFSVAALHDPQHDTGDDRNSLKSELIWIHSSGMSLQWDAPLDTQEHFKDESDPPPRVFSPPPFLTLEGDFDPDQRTEILHAYAAEVRSLDESLERYFEAIEPQAENNLQTLTLFCGLRGFPLGEHLHVGIPSKQEDQYKDFTSPQQFPAKEELYCENLHVPFFLTNGLVTVDPVEPNESSFEGYRIDQFLQTSDIGSILTNWLIDSENSPLQIATNPNAISTGHNQSRIQTDDWSLILGKKQSPESLDSPSVENGSRRMLFAKPDDRLEINEVSGICEEIADELEARLKKQLLKRGFV